jgi:aryl-alcohol dehydrogenase-like predicted oxidoreductase
MPTLGRTGLDVFPICLGGKEALDAVAAARDVPVAAVALAWLRAHPRVKAPIASARTASQLEEILPAATLELTPQEVDRLSATSR